MKNETTLNYIELKKQYNEMKRRSRPSKHDTSESIQTEKSENIKRIEREKLYNTEKLQEHWEYIVSNDLL